MSVKDVRQSMAMLFAVTMLVVGFLTWVSAKRDDDIAENTRKIETTLVTVCENGNRAAEGTNSVLDALIAGAVDSGVLAPQEKADRIARYKDAKVPIVACLLRSG